MEIKLTEKQFRRLLDLVYIGNWVLNSTRGDDRIRQYDQVESLIFSHCLNHGMAGLTASFSSSVKSVSFSRAIHSQMIIASSSQHCGRPGLCRGRHPRGHHGL